MLFAGALASLGKNEGGVRYVGADKLHPGNVEKLKLAWRYEVDLPAQAELSLEATPLFANGRLYFWSARWSSGCTESG
ncbi:MAG: hypothetical protein KatS3mg124_0643 [Porticoccaceae bacterium]|nr:MAG: hypothetical protein KatS3mg124_0643 [Porticoccaceae bacterium]